MSENIICKTIKRWILPSVFPLFLFWVTQILWFNYGLILSGMKPIIWDLSGEYVAAMVEGNKLRRDCSPVNNSARGLAKIGKHWEDVEFSFNKDRLKEDYINRPAGLQNFGMFYWFTDSQQRRVVQSVGFEIDYICGNVIKRPLLDANGKRVRLPSGERAFYDDESNLIKRTVFVGPFSVPAGDGIIVLEDD